VDATALEPTPRERTNVARALKRLRARPVAWRPVTRGGHTPARRWVVELDDGSSAFVKVAADDMTASWIRDEHLMYSVLRGATFMPGYLGSYDDGERPVLALEDLSRATWPPPWNEERIASLRRTLVAVAATPPPDGLPLLDDDHLGLRDGWDDIERDPTRFLELRLCEPAWLVGHLPALRRAAATAPLAGSALQHVDVRSDNVCFRADGTAVLVDWNWASVGNPRCDLAFWLPSLHHEGGPSPEEVAPGVPAGLAACVAGYFCSHAGRENIPTAPRVRRTQLAQARTALPWAARALGLEEPVIPRHPGR